MIYFLIYVAINATVMYFDREDILEAYSVVMGQEQLPMQAQKIVYVVLLCVLLLTIAPLLLVVGLVGLFNK